MLSFRPYQWTQVSIVLGCSICGWISTEKRQRIGWSIGSPGPQGHVLCGYWGGQRTNEVLSCCTKGWVKPWGDVCNRTLLLLAERCFWSTYVGLSACLPNGVHHSLILLHKWYELFMDVFRASLLSLSLSVLLVHSVLSLFLFLLSFTLFFPLSVDYCKAIIYTITIQ